MPKKEKDIRAKKDEKPDKNVNKPIQAIKKLKDHFYKSSKKNKSGTTDTILPIASRATDASDTVISHPTESIRGADLSRESIISRSAEPIQYSMESTQAINTSSNSIPIQNVDVSRTIGASTSRYVNSSRTVEKIRDDTVESQMPNISHSAIADIPLKKLDTSRESHLVDAFHVNDLSRNVEMQRKAEMVHDIETRRNYELAGKNIDVTHEKSLMNGQKSSQENTEPLSQSRASQSQSQLILMSAEDTKAMSTELSEKPEIESLSDTAIEQQLESLNQRLKALIDEDDKASKREEQLFAAKNQVIAKIDLVKKQIGEAMDHYREIAHACHEKIEKEEILQNEVRIYQIFYAQIFKRNVYMLSFYIEVNNNAIIHIILKYLR
ncbi:unnamed protein product [Onchocerca ochengi]|uniref:TACC_C domain-containing protein n=1 Tax=Onchocerca ochengi TaxID=42157 RepID=A0A182EP57_ONCOC|nr:unnamed protein product [Onchocerca ochengi]